MLVARAQTTPSTAKNKLGKVLYGNMYREIKSGAACNTLMEAYISRKKAQQDGGASHAEMEEIDTRLPPFLRQRLPTLAQRKRGRKNAAAAAAAAAADADNGIAETTSISDNDGNVPPMEHSLASPTTSDTANPEGILPPLFGPAEIADISAGTPPPAPANNENVSSKGKRAGAAGGRRNGDSSSSSRKQKLLLLRRSPPRTKQLVVKEESPASTLLSAAGNRGKFSRKERGGGDGSASDSYAVGGQHHHHHRQRNRRGRGTLDGNRPGARDGPRKQRRGGDASAIVVGDFSSAAGGMFSRPPGAVRRRRRNVTTSASLATLSLGPTGDSAGYRRKNAALNM